MLTQRGHIVVNRTCLTLPSTGVSSPPPRSPVRRARGKGEEAAVADAADHERRGAGIGRRSLVCLYLELHATL